MAMMKFAYARVTQPRTTPKSWEKTRTAARKANANMAPDLLKQAEDILGQPFTPDRYLLTHCTIVASVSTERVPNCKTGKVKVGSEQINRPWDDYYITADTEAWVNNNGDSWSRGVLAKSYKTFIGAANYVEHVQLPEHNKGRIIDAVLRDVGDSLYVDILVATDRKHTELVADIESGKMATLSMGCVIDGSQCTRCGNWAPDETTACRHIKFEKGNKFFDDQGNQRVVAELCGHESLDPNGGVQFIEASWVKTPAFTGAALRNVIDPIKVAPEVMGRANEILRNPPSKWAASPADVLKVANQPQNVGAVIVGKTPGWKGSAPSSRLSGWGEPEEEEAPKEEAPAKSPLDQAVDDTYEEVMKRVKKRVKDNLNPPPVPKSESTGPAQTNDNLNKDATRQKLAALRYRAGLDALCKVATSDADLMDKVARFNASKQIEISTGLYRAALRVGGTHKHASLGRYIAACAAALGRRPTAGEKRTLVRLGSLLASRRARR